jgi:exonuclease 1
MGIQGLLPALASITQAKHVSYFAGKKAAIDAYCWLHKAAYTCA